MGASARQEARQRAAEVRAESLRKATRRRRLIVALVVVAVLVVAGGITAVVLLSTRSSADVAAGRTSAPPWAAPADTVARVQDAGLTMLTAEGEALHIHQHLTITVDGAAVQVPALIGIQVVDGREKALSAIHTHDTTGIIHVESPVVKQFFLGQVFTEWDVALAAGRVGSYRDGQNGVRIALFVDRKPYTGDPTKLVLAGKQDIDFVITTDGSTPAAPTEAFTFPEGY